MTGDVVTITPALSARSRLGTPVFLGVAVFALGVVLVMVEGRRGFMPLDQSIVFDAGWRMLDGQVPLRDFVTPNGFVPAAIQAALFFLFGVSWTTYLLQSAVLNGLMGLLVLAVLVRLGLPVLPAATYAAASVVVFHPPFGSPSVEQPSFFFALVAAALAMETATATGRRRLWVSASVPLAITLSILSKQIPAAFMLPLVAVLLVVHPHRVQTLRWFLGGSVAVIAVLGLGVLALGVPPGSIATHVWSLPRSTGAERLAWTPSPLWGVLVPPWELLAPVVAATGAALLAIGVTASSSESGGRARDRRPRNQKVRGLATPLAVLILSAALATFVAVPSPPIVRGVRGPPPQAPLLGALTGFAIVTAVAWLLLHMRSALRRRQAPRPGAAGLPFPLAVTVPLVLVIVSTTFVAFTNNQIENGAAYVFLALGALHAALLRVDWGRVTGLPVSVVIAITLPGIAVADAVRFHLDVNRTRAVHDFLFDADAATTTGLPAGFDVALDGPVMYDAEGFGAAVAAVRRLPGEVLVFGDSSVIAALAGKSSIAPGLWWHPGLVFPYPDSAAFPAFDERLADTLRRPDVGGVLVEQAANPWRPSPADRAQADATPKWARQTTWIGVRLLDFPRALAVVQQRRCSSQELGAFTLLRFCASGDGALATGNPGALPVRGHRP